jgi:L-rhamnose mutarotase
MPERIAFRMYLNPGQAAEYEKRHNEIFPALVDALKVAGVSYYGSWLDPEDHHLFGILTRSNGLKLSELPDTEVMRRGWAFMCDIMESHPNNAPVQIPLKRVFDLP